MQEGAQKLTTTGWPRRGGRVIVSPPPTSSTVKSGAGGPSGGGGPTTTDVSPGPLPGISRALPSTMAAVATTAMPTSRAMVRWARAADRSGVRGRAGAGGGGGAPGGGLGAAGRRGPARHDGRPDHDVGVDDADEPVRAGGQGGHVVRLRRDPREDLTVEERPDRDVVRQLVLVMEHELEGRAGRQAQRLRRERRVPGRGLDGGGGRAGGGGRRGGPRPRPP